MAAPLCLSQVMNRKWNILIQKRCYPKKMTYRTFVNQCPPNSVTSETLPYDPGTENSKINYFCLPDENMILHENKSRKYETPHNICEVTGESKDGILHMGRKGVRQGADKKSFVQSQRRWNSDWNPNKGLPQLMDFPEIVWPSVFKTLRNRILASFIITPYFDNEFRLPEFVYGTKQAVESVSDCLSRGDCKALDGLITDDALKEVKTNIRTFSETQRSELKILKEDIYFAFPYQIGIMFNDDDQNQKRFVEITMVYHVLRGLKEMRAQEMNIPMNMGMLPEYQDKLQLCNYRFIREYTKGVESDWTVNVVNHFKPQAA